MKIRTDFVTNSSSSSFLVIRITKKDGTAIVLEEEEHCFWDIPGDFECASPEDLYNALVDGFDGETDGVEDFLNQVLAIEDIDDVVSMEIEDTSTAWEGDLENPEDCENYYDDVEYDEEDGMLTCANNYFYMIKDGMATLTEQASKQNEPQFESGVKSVQFFQPISPAPTKAWEELFAPWILERGREYANSGKISDIRQFREVRATVQGQEDYEVTITFNVSNEVWGTDCTCPYAQEGHNCKHIAAVLYTLDLQTAAETRGEVDFNGDCGSAELTPQELSEDDKTESSDCAKIDGLAGKTFVITGDFYYYSSRELLRRIIETHGGKVTGSVSSKTTALITNCPDSGTKKIKKAKELGVEIINEEEFDNRYLFRKGDYANKTKMLYPDFNIVYGAITRYSGPDGAVVIPDGVTAIGDEAFAGTNITSVVIPESVTTIGFRAFSSCKRLTSITIPEHTERIGYGAFSKCENLTIRAPYGSSAERYAMENNILFDGIGTKKLTPIDPALKFDDSMEAVNAVFRGPDQDVAVAKAWFGVAVRRVALGVSEFKLNGTREILWALENMSNLKAVMFVEFFNRNEVHMAYSRSGYPHITDTYFVGYCDFHSEWRWDWKHLPTEKQFRTSSLFSNSGERVSVSYSFRMERDWNAMNYYFIPDNAPKQAEKTDNVSITKLVMEQVVVNNGSDLCVDELKGKTFVVTGDLFHYASRDVLKGIIEERGGKLTGSISSKTTALITNFPDSGTTKIKKAQELGIEIITEEEFIRRFLE